MATVALRWAIGAVALAVTFGGCSDGVNDVDDNPDQATVTEEARSVLTDLSSLLDAGVDERLVGVERCRDDSLVYISLWAHLPLGRPAQVADLDTVGARLLDEGFEEVSREDSAGSVRRYWERPSTEEAFEAFVPDGSDYLDVTAVSRCAQPEPT